jgi:hypothetical protein
MKQVITGADAIFGPWIMEQTDGSWFPGKGSTIGLVGESKILAAVLFEGCNGASVILHCAGLGKNWLNRKFLWYVFHYPFEELKVHKIISPVESSNLDCIRFIEHIGFTCEATLVDASPRGNLLIYTMSKDQCRWLQQGKNCGKTKSSSTPGLCSSSSGSG